MSRDVQNLFLAQRAYRKRRMGDAARVLPIFGAVLLCLPMLWSLPEETAVTTTYVMRFLFLSWFGLIILAAVISSRLPESSNDMDEVPKPDTQDR